MLVNKSSIIKANEPVFDVLANIGFGLLKFKPTILFNMVTTTWSDVWVVFIGLSRSMVKFMTVSLADNPRNNKFIQLPGCDQSVGQISY